MSRAGTKDYVTPGEKRRLRAKHRNRIAHQVQRYIEHVWPHLERVSSTPDLPMNRKAKGETNPPMPESAIALLDANRDVANAINIDLAAVESSNTEYAGVTFRSIIRDIKYDAGVITNWRSSDPLMSEAFWKMCQHVADLVLMRFPKLDADTFWVETSMSKAMSDPRKSNRHTQSYNAGFAYREIVARLERIEAQDPMATRTKAIEALREELKEEGLDASMPRIWKAIEFVNKERGEVKVQSTS